MVRGEEELHARSAHLFAAAREVACAARDLHTWVVARRSHPSGPPDPGKRIRKLFQPGVLVDPESADHLRTLENIGAEVRITPHEINETIILDGRLAIVAGDLSCGIRDYSVITRPDLVRGVASLFDAAWRSATDLAVYDARFAEVVTLAPRILDLLASGCKDETAARTLGLGLRTYRRRVAELMAALGASSRFQAGARARDLGLI